MRIKHTLFFLLFLSITLAIYIAPPVETEATATGRAKVNDRHDHQHHDGTAEEHHSQESHGTEHTTGDNKAQHDSHNEHSGDEHEGHGQEEGAVITMTRAQQEESGLVVKRAVSGDIEKVLSLVGEVRLNEDRIVHLVPLISGVVASVSVSLGDEVGRGQVLATIESPELAGLKADYLEKLQHLELSRRTFERKQYLKNESIASEADWLEAQAAFHNAKTMVLAAKHRLMALGLQENEINAIPDSTGRAFSRYPLEAPISGTIIERHITRGEKIDGEEVFTIADLSRVWVDLRIPAQDLWRVKKDIPVEISSPEGRTAKGKLALIGPVVNEESRTALGRVFLENPDGYWKPGLFINGRIMQRTTATAVVVPTESIYTVDGENVIFIPSGDGFKTVEVTTGRNSKGKTEILAGLQPGQKYVAKGGFALKAIKVTTGLGSHAGHGH